MRSRTIDRFWLPIVSGIKVGIDSIRKDWGSDWLADRLWTWQDTQIRQPYKQSPWVYSAISTAAEMGSKVPYVIKKVGSDQIIESGKEVELFRDVNPHSSRFELWEATQTFVRLQGNCWWFFYLDESGSSFPKEIWYFGRSNVLPRYNQKRELEAWTLEVGTERQTFPLDQVIHFKLFNPYNSIFGMSTIEAASLGIQIDYMSSLADKAFYQNDSTPGGVLTTEGSLTDPQRTRMRVGWERRQGGVNNQMRVAIMEGGVTYQTITPSKKDQQRLEERKFDIEMIGSVTKTPPIYLNQFDDASYNNAREQKKMMWERNLQPGLVKMQEKIGTDFFPLYASDKYGAFDFSGVEALQEDLKDKTLLAKTYFDMYVPFNMINERLELGFPSVIGGDTRLVPITLAPIEHIVDADGKSIRNTDTEEDRVPEPKIKVRKTRDDVWLERYYKLFVDSFKPLQTRYMGKVRKLFMDLRAETLNRFFDNFTEEGSAQGGIEKISDAELIELVLFDLQSSSQKLIDTSTGYFQEGYKIGGDMIPVEVGIDEVFNVNSPEVLRAMRAKLIKVVDVLPTIRRALKKTLLEGLEAGEGVQALALRIRNVFNASMGRARTIARTEIGSSVSEGRFLSEQDFGVEEHEWNAALVETRESHEKEHGSVVKVGELFPFTGLRFPLDPEGTDPGEIINCGCVELPIEAKRFLRTDTFPEWRV